MDNLIYSDSEPNPKLAKAKEVGQKEFQKWTRRVSEMSLSFPSKEGKVKFWEEHRDQLKHILFSEEHNLANKAVLADQGNYEFYHIYWEYLLSLKWVNEQIELIKNPPGIWDIENFHVPPLNEAMGNVHWQNIKGRFDQNLELKGILKFNALFRILNFLLAKYKQGDYEGFEGAYDQLVEKFSETSANVIISYFKHLVIQQGSIWGKGGKGTQSAIQKLIDSKLKLHDMETQDTNKRTGLTKNQFIILFDFLLDNIGVSVNNTDRTALAKFIHEVTGYGEESIRRDLSNPLKTDAGFFRTKDLEKLKKLFDQLDTDKFNSYAQKKESAKNL